MKYVLSVSYLPQNISVTLVLLPTSVNSLLQGGKDAMNTEVHLHELVLLSFSQHMNLNQPCCLLTVA